MTTGKEVIQFVLDESSIQLAKITAVGVGVGVGSMGSSLTLLLSRNPGEY